MKWIAFTIHNNYSDIKNIRFSRTYFSHGQKYIGHSFVDIYANTCMIYLFRI